MNGAYLHLLINHVPVILAPLGAAAAIVALVTRRRGVWLYALASLTIAGAAAIPTKLTGEPAEHVVVRTVPGVDRRTIHDHEEAGDLATWVLLAAGLAAAYGWWRLARGAGSLPGWLAAVVVLAALGAAGTVTYASLESGYIIHKEAHIPADQIPAGRPPRAGAPDSLGAPAPAAPTT